MRKPLTELAKQLFKPVDVQELQDPEKLSAIWVKNQSSIVKRMNNTNLLMIGIKTKDAIKLNIVELDKSETYPKEKIYLKIVYADIYIDMVKNMKIKKDGLLTLTEL